MKTLDDMIKEKVEELLLLAKANGSENYLDIDLEDGTNVIIQANTWAASSARCW